MISVKFLIASAAAVFACSASTVCAQDCTISVTDKTKLLALGYHEFDQSLVEGGWRGHADKGCYSLAASLLDLYNELHKDTMLDWQTRVVTWHAGQMHAFDNNYNLAKDRFQNSYNPTESADSPLLWNDYVSATLAFLDKDLERLKLHRNRIANGPTWNGTKGNLDVVNGLLKCIDKPYVVAYSDPTCRGSTRLMVGNR